MTQLPDSDVRLTRLSPDDVRRRSDVFLRFRELVIANEESYPGIARWVDEKVVLGVRSKQRTAFVAFLNDQPVATAVVKRGREAKFCHLRLSEAARDQNLGELFFALMAAEARHDAEEVHFTLPESLWAEKESFFRSFGFTSASLAARQYRLFEEELRCTAAFVDVWRSVIEKIPKLARRFAIHGHAMFSPLLLSVAPRFAGRIFNGEKAVEVRRRFSTRWAGMKSVVYSSSPEKSLLGEVEIANVVSGSPENIWNSFSSGLGCTHEEFDLYVRGSDQVYALVLNEVVPYSQPIPLSQLEFLLQDELTPPQSYCTTANNAKWSAALAIAALLHGSAGTSNQHMETPATARTTPSVQMSLI